jgi:hypothetical protein
MKIHNVEQGSDAWRSIRAGKPCASEYSRIITSDGTRSKSFSGYAKTLAGEVYAGKSLDPWEGNSWSERGKELEDSARQFYAFTRGVTPEKVGFVTDDAETHGCSPDSFIGADGLLEIKVLKAERHIDAILYFQKHGKCPTDYVQQTQGQIRVCERQWCDLFFYHPELPPLVIRQTPIPAVQDALAVEIPALIKERDVILSALRRHAEAA